MNRAMKLRTKLLTDLEKQIGEKRTELIEARNIDEVRKLMTQYHMMVHSYSKVQDDTEFIVAFADWANIYMEVFGWEERNFR